MSFRPYPISFYGVDLKVDFGGLEVMLGTELTEAIYDDRDERELDYAEFPDYPHLVLVDYGHVEESKTAVAVKGTVKTGDSRDNLLSVIETISHGAKMELLSFCDKYGVDFDARFYAGVWMI